MQKRYGPAAGVCHCTLHCICDAVCSVCKRTTKEEEDCLAKLGIRMLIMVFFPFFAANFPLSWNVGLRWTINNILRELYGDESGSTSTTRYRPSRHRVPRLRRQTVSSALVHNVRGRNSTLRICIIRCPTIAAAATGPNRPHYWLRSNFLAGEKPHEWVPSRCTIATSRSVVLSSL